MRNLLSANFLRLRKNGLFWGLLLVFFAFGTLFTLHRVSDQGQLNFRFYLTEDLFVYAQLVGFGMAAFIPLFLGAEYSDGTIRNKVIFGHSRLSIYLSHLITGIAAAVLAAAAYLAPVLAIGAFVFEPPDMDMGTLLLLLLGTLALLAAYCALYTFLIMNWGGKSRAAVICLTVMLVLYLAAGFTEASLMQPEYMHTEFMESGEIIHRDPNPRYAGGAKRQALETLYDLLPTGQSLQYMRVKANHPVRLSLYSLIDTAALTALGAALFQRKDIK